MQIFTKTLITGFLLCFVIFSRAIGQYVLKISAFNNGGALITNSTYSVNGVIGQAAIGSSDDGSTFAESGFIATAWQSIVYDESLPVELMSFSATTPGDSIILIQFSTASEVNVAGFNILRSLEENGNYLVVANYIQNNSLLSFGNSAVGGDYSWKDRSAVPGTNYWYKLQNVDIDGSSETFGPVHACLKELPQKFVLYQNYPNPFNPATTIKYELPQAGRVKIDVYNILGQHVHTLLDAPKDAGYYELIFNASNMSSGLYYYIMVAGSFNAIKRMILIK